MNEWKVVPVEPNTAILDVLYDNGMDEFDEQLRAVYSAMLAAAPTPPVVLPPLPPHPRDSWGLWDADEKRAIEDYARAALAQYGIVDRQEDAA